MTYGTMTQVEYNEAKIKYREYSDRYGLQHDYSSPLSFDKWVEAGKPQD
jgi:hypothetical protein